MHPYLIFSIFLISSWAQATEFPLTLDKETRISKIKHNVYVATELRFHKTNILLVKLKDGTVVLSSSPFENEGTKRILKWVKQNLRPKKMVAINTHFHLDGTGGNQIYHQQGVETWASYQTAKLQMSEGKKILKLVLKNNPPDIQKRVAATRFEVAKNLFQASQGKTFDFSGEKVEIFYPGEAHSPDNLVVYFPSQKVLFGGCMVKPKKLGWLRNANLKSWPTSAQKLLSFDVDHVIPGHGKWGDRSLLEKTLEVATKALNEPGIMEKSFH